MGQKEQKDESAVLSDGPGGKRVKASEERAQCFQKGIQTAIPEG